MTTEEPAQAGEPSVLDQRFDGTSLSELRASTHAWAARAGIPADRATDLVVALHELAANAVRHGAGSGRLRIWDRADVLYCSVDDAGPAAADTAGTDGQNLADHWPYQPGHGLWLARQVADRVTLRSDARGTRAVLIFSWPSGSGPRGSLPRVSATVNEAPDAGRGRRIRHFTPDWDFEPLAPLLPRVMTSQGLSCSGRANGRKPWDSHPRS